MLPLGSEPNWSERENYFFPEKKKNETKKVDLVQDGLEDFSQGNFHIYIYVAIRIYIDTERQENWNRKRERERDKNIVLYLL